MFSFDYHHRRRIAWTTIATTILLTACGDSNDPPADAVPPVAVSPSPAAPEPPPATLKSAFDVGLPLAAAELDAALLATTAAGLTGAARCDVQMVDITYTTPAPDGVTPADVSGVAMIPTGPGCSGPYPLVAYSRGTDTDKARALATPGDDEARLVAALLAAQGFMVAATDYLGYARSTWPDHPYLHADSAATANVNALRAARQVAAQRNLPLNGKVFVTGYSQGGHAAMATQKLIESSLASEFALAGAGPMSGPYNLVNSVQASLSRLPLGDLGSTYYIPFAVTSLQKVYKDLYATPGQFFRSPYDQTIESLFPGPAEISLPELIAQDKLPILLSSLITDDLVKAALDPGSSLNRALVLNSPTDFAPKAPTLLCGGSRDPVVNFANTTNALTAFQAGGAPAVTIFNVEDEPAYQGLLRDDLVPVSIYAGYHASLVPPLCLLQVRNLFLTL